MFLVSLMSFIFIRKHFLLCLMSLEEFIVMSLLFLIMYFLMFSYSLYLYIVFDFLCMWGCFGFTCISVFESLSW